MIWLFTALAAIALAIRLHDFFEGERLIPDLFDEWRLARTDIAALDARWAENPRRSETVISLTTIPSRMPFLAETLKSLMRQSVAPAQIRLNLPRFSKRENCAYVIPDYLRALKSVTIVACEDYGPATKLIPSLEALGPDQKILVLDDDRIYPKDMLATLDSAADAATDKTFTYGGWVAPRDLIDRPTTMLTNLMQTPPAPIRAVRQKKMFEVDIFQGMAGYLVRPRFFDLKSVKDYGAAPKAAFYVDDVWLSGHCMARKYVVPARASNFQPRRRMVFYKRTSLGWINRGKTGDADRNNSVMLRHLADKWRVGGPNGG